MRIRAASRFRLSRNRGFPLTGGVITVTPRTMTRSPLIPSNDCACVQRFFRFYQEYPVPCAELCVTTDQDEPGMESARSEQ